MKDYMRKYEEWLNNDLFDEEAKAELRAIRENEKEIEDRFYQDLEFGTAGLRGIIGMGSNRMNKYTVGKATQGLAQYILEQDGCERGVAISYDCRHMSKEFAELTALCLNANGIKTYIADELRAVPELSYAVRYFKCIAGVMITASHNPPMYNGYKVYWEDGSQIVPPVDKDIITHVKNTDFKDIKTMSKEEAKAKSLYKIFGQELEDAYIETIKAAVLNKDTILETQEELKIVYSPLHGTGNKPVKRVLKELGFTNVYVVSEQEEPDGDFPTVEFPNPESPEAMKLALELAKKVDADIVLATDPDADRLGVYTKDNNGGYFRYTGNMSAMLLLEYKLSQMKAKGMLEENSAVLTTIVSTKMAKAICDSYGVKLYETLTGFKWIGEQMRKFRTSTHEQFIFGFEESYGCLISDYVGDKDGISAVMQFCEALAYYKSKGISLYDQMQNIYKNYGYYLEDQVSITLKGVDGAKVMKEKMANLKEAHPTMIGDIKVVSERDYEAKKIFKGGECIGNTHLPVSKVIYYEFEDNQFCVVRPSGTEPKIKLYCGVVGNSYEEAKTKLDLVITDLKKLVG